MKMLKTSLTLLPITLLAAACGSSDTREDPNDAEVLDTSDDAAADVGEDVPADIGPADVDAATDTTGDVELDEPDVDVPDTDGPDTDGPDALDADVDEPDADASDVDTPDVDAPDADDADSDALSCVEHRDCAGGQLCRDDVCVDVCVDNSDCLEGVCDAVNGVCVECNASRDCAGEQVCREHMCVAFECEPGVPGCDPCLELVPELVEFGDLEFGETGAAMVTIRNCNDPRGFDLMIDDIALTGDAAIAYSVDTAAPIVLGPQETSDVEVLFTPPQRIDRYDAELLVSSNVGDGRVELHGAVVDVATCPTAVAQCSTDPAFFDPPGSSAIVVEAGEVVNCNADQSSAEGTIADYSWSFVNVPDGTVDPPITPSAASSRIEFVPPVDGVYVLELEVVTEGGVPSCFPDRATVTAQTVAPPEDLITINLTWDTPGDPNPDDTGFGNGADLDLLLRHPTATSWADGGFVVDFRNENPDWGPAGPTGDPELVRDDTDGWGPETITLNPQDGISYRVGIDYYADGGFGPSIPTIQIYRGASLAVEHEFRDADPFTDREFLAAGTFTVSDGAVTFTPDGTQYSGRDTAP